MLVLGSSLLSEKRSAGGVWASGVAGEVVDGVDALLGGGAQDAHDRRLGGRAAPGPVAAPHFAVDDRGADGLFGPPVGGLDIRPGQEGDDGFALVVEMLDEFAVLVVGMGLAVEQL